MTENRCHALEEGPPALIATSLILAGTAGAQTPAPGGGTTTPGMPTTRTPDDADRAGQPDAEYARHVHSRSAGKLDPGDAGSDPGRAVPARPGAAAG